MKCSKHIICMFTAICFMCIVCITIIIIIISTIITLPGQAPAAAAAAAERPRRRRTVDIISLCYYLALFSEVFKYVRLDKDI